MEGIEQKTLAQIVIAEPETASVMEKFGLDFCCKGKQTLTEACANAGKDIKVVIQDIETAIRKVDKNHPPEHFEKMELDALVSHILHHHHDYMKRSMPVIHTHLSKIAGVHGERHPELHEVLRNFDAMMMDLEQHLLKEEEVLFPYIKTLVLAKHEPDHHHFGKTHFIENPIRVMLSEHDRAGELMGNIREFINGFELPADACTTYKTAFHQLKKFEEDLHLHVHLENNILFPKAKALENVLFRVISDQ